MDKKLTFILILIAAITGCSSGTNTRTEEPMPVKPAPEQLVLKRFRNADADNDMYVGWRLARSGNYKKSALLFEKLISTGYSHYDLYFGAGYSYFKYYDLEKALKYLTLAINSRSDHFEALFFRAKIYLEMKNYQAAREDFNKLLSINKAEPIQCGMFQSDRLTDSELTLCKSEARSLLNLK